MWFVEGQATQIGDIFEKPSESIMDVLRVSAAFPSPSGSSSLSALETYSGMDCCGLAYSRGMFAANYLTGQYGLPEVMSFLKDAGSNGMTWQAAFQKNFGITYDNFYSNFEPYSAWMLQAMDRMRS